jgi:hypothetical protein
MPRLPPVMTTTFPWNSPGICIPPQRLSRRAGEAGHAAVKEYRDTALLRLG